MTPVVISSADKLSLTFFMAGIVHALVILGVGFDVDKPSSIGKRLEIVLVKSAENERPDKADFLAQENQLGSGEAEEKGVNQQQSTPRPSPKDPVISEAIKRNTRKHTQTTNKNTKSKTAGTKSIAASRSKGRYRRW